MQIVHYDTTQARLYIRVGGFWGLDEAIAHNEAVFAACRAAAASGRAIAVLSDTSGYQPQSGPVGELQERLPEAFAGVRVDRIAVVAPSALVRMGTRRRLQGVPHALFEELAPALEWLGWTEAYIRQCEADAATRRG